MVVNSDDDNDSSSLEDLDDLIRLKGSEISDATLGRADEIQGLGLGSGAQRHASNRRRTARITPAPPNVTEYKYSLAVLGEQRRLLEKSEEDMAKVNVLLEARQQAHSRDGQAMTTDGLSNERVIDAVISYAGDEEEVSRLKNALRRTEALHHNRTWSFFETKVEVDTAAPLDLSGLDDLRLRQILQNPSSQQQAFLNGYVEDYVAKKDLPDELLLWIMERACLERREDLRQSYVHVLSELGSRNDGFLSTKGINELFRRIGARDEALEMEKPIVPYNSVSANTEGTILDRLLSALGLIKNLSNILKPDTIIYAICIICRLLLDNQVVGNCDLMTALDETLSCLIESIPEVSYESGLYKTLVAVYGSVHDPVLRLQLVRNLPVDDTRTAVFRRRLALAFFFEDRKYLGKPAEEQMLDLDSTTVYLQTSRFIIDKKTDFAQLTTTMAMLDIGIDAGDPLLPFATNKDERNFDRAIDRLSRRLKDLSSQIVGTSALDMRRTEAKEILAAIQRRLTYAVRCRPPPKKTILADPAAGSQSEKGAINEYLDRTRMKDPDGLLSDVTRTSINQNPDMVSEI